MTGPNATSCAANARTASCLPLMVELRPSCAYLGKHGAANPATGKARKAHVRHVRHVRHARHARCARCARHARHAKWANIVRYTTRSEEAAGRERERAAVRAGAYASILLVVRTFARANG